VELEYLDVVINRKLTEMRDLRWEIEALYELRKMKKAQQEKKDEIRPQGSE
jgi:hypothetical protein